MRRAWTTILAIAFAGMALPAVAADPDPAQRVFSCDGPVFRVLSSAALVRVYGPANVSVDTERGAEGEGETIVTDVFEKRPAGAFTVYWRDPAKKIVDGVKISGSHWIGPRGLHIGSTLWDVEKVNGRPFTFTGLGWDYGGEVTDWRGGALEQTKAMLGGNIAPGCNLAVTLGSAPDAPQKAVDAVSGEEKFSSGDPKAIAARIVVIRIGISYGAR